MPKKKVLVAGATGYLGRFIVAELKSRGYWVRALSRNAQRIQPIKPQIDDLFIAQATQPETLHHICQDIDIVISTLGITKQKDGQTYMDVDYQANKNLLNEAIKKKVSTFMYISVFNAQKLRHLQIVKAKEQFVDELRAAGLHCTVIRPNGFFSDTQEFLNMAKKGRIYLLGRGEYRANPIHGADLARACCEKLESGEEEIDIGGPQVLTQNQIASLAFEVLGEKPKITHIPLWLGRLTVTLAKLLTSVKTYGPLEFFMTVLTMDMVAPAHGEHTLKHYFTQITQAKDS